MSMTEDKQNNADLVTLNMKNWHGSDLSSFFGRLQYFTSVTAPHKSFYTSSSVKDYNEKVKAVMARADDKGNVTMSRTEAEDFQHQKTILASCMNPDTEEPIMWAGRVSAFIPTNVPIIAAMLMTAPTPTNVIFWQWLN